jgi:hypothetical protein
MFSLLGLWILIRIGAPLLRPTFQRRIWFGRRRFSARSPMAAELINAATSVTND